MNEKVFCEECRDDVTYKVFEVNFSDKFKGKMYDYLGQRAVCNKCGLEVDVPEVRDFNLKAIYDAYRVENDLISIEQILEILKKYNIGKRPFSLLLGWGELSFTRYCMGYLPTKQYSDILKQVYDSPAFYLSLLESNKDRVSDTTYQKSKHAVEALSLDKKADSSKIDIVIDYLLCKCQDITPMALQKSLYYIQGFYYAFTGTFIFAEECQAWVHGPVYREIYTRYSHYQFESIDVYHECDDTGLTVSEKSVIDSIIRNFCCYSGKILEHFTHSETPWINTRGDLKINEPSNRIIDKKLLGSFFKEIRKLYKMVTPSDIQNYSKNLFEKFN